MRYDLVVFGATSFVGQILARYLLERHGVGGGLKWAIAARSAGRLASLRDTLGPAAEALPTLVADADDEVALRALCEQTRVVISTVGPYALYGSKLVKACVETGTDYCDLTGEVQWIARMLAEHEAAARKSGARIVHCCGFDSIPSDLGTYVLQQRARERFGLACVRVKLRTKVMRGGLSGGTVASLVNFVTEAARSPELRRLAANPYALVTGDTRGLPPRQPDVRGVEYDADARCWVGPFVMAAINTRVVHRSNALAGYAYGRDFLYDEASMTGRGWRGYATGAGLAAGLGGFIALAALPPARRLLQQYVLPKPGEGPSPEQQRNGRFDLRLFGQTAEGRRLQLKVTGDRDPGYGSTAKMLGEAAVCLAQDIAKDARAGGFWTPSTIFGERLVERLEAHAGLAFEFLD